MTSIVNFWHVLCLAGMWWIVFSTGYRAVASRVEHSFGSDVVDDLYTVVSLAGVLSFMAFAPGLV